MIMDDELKQEYTECRDLVKQKVLNKDAWKNLYNKDFLRVNERVPPLSERMKMQTPYRYEMFMQEIRPETTKILDVGCGDTYFLSLVKNNFNNVECCGIDVSEEAIMRGDNDVNICIGFAEELPYEDNKFDIVYCSQLLEHIKDPLVVVKELKRVCKVGGLVVVTVPIGTNLLDPLHLRFFDYYDNKPKECEGLMELFEQCFNDFRIYTTYKFDVKKENEKVFYVRCIK